MGWLLLAGAILTEVAGTVALRFSAGFSRLVPSAVVVVGYGASFYFLALTLRRLSLSTAYAVWSGVGTALVATVGVLWLGERLTALKLAGLLLIVLGVVLLQLVEAGH
jgi:small multidrug resistance pump